jgi:hypothetical protein
MKHFLATSISAVCFVGLLIMCLPLAAQRSTLVAPGQRATLVTAGQVFMASPDLATAKTEYELEMIIPGNWNNSTGVSIYPLLEGRGYVFGTNVFDDRAKGQKFWLEQEIALEGAIFWFPYVEYGGGNLTFKVWNMSGTGVGEVLASKTVSIGDIVPAETFEEAFHLSFDEPVYVSGDYMVGFVMDDVAGSELALAASLSGEGGSLGLVYEQWENGSWHVVLQVYGPDLDVDLAIFPLKYTGEVPTSAPVFQPQVEMTVFPNPASDILNVVSPEPMQEVRILDMLGKVVHSARPNSPEVRIDTSGFWPGIYFVQVFTAREVTTKRVQVSR